MKLKRIHHVAIIASNYQVSKHFYCQILGLDMVAEHYRAESDSWKADLALDGLYQIELFSFPTPPARASYPEACGLRHLAFRVDNLDEWVEYLGLHGVVCEEPRADPYTQKRFTFFTDPDGLPLELYCD